MWITYWIFLFSLSAVRLCHRHNTDWKEKRKTLENFMLYGAVIDVVKGNEKTKAEHPNSFRFLREHMWCENEEKGKPADNSVFLTQSMFGPATLYVVTFLHYVNQCKHRNMMRLPHMKYGNALFIQKYFHIALLSSNILEHRLSQWLWGGDSTLCSSHLGRWWQIFFILTKTNPSYSIFYILLATKLKMNYWVDTRPIKWLCIQSS